MKTINLNISDEQYEKMEKILSHVKDVYNEIGTIENLFQKAIAIQLTNWNVLYFNK